MPKSQGLKIGNPLGIFKYMHSKEPVLTEVGGVVIAVCAIATAIAVPIGIAETKTEQKEAIIADATDALTGHNEGITYSITEADQLSFTLGETQYEVDFNMDVVTIDGPGEADRVISFSEIEDPDFVNRALQAGLSISEAFESALDENLSENEKAWLEKDGSRQDTANEAIEQSRQKAALFANKHG